MDLVSSFNYFSSLILFFVEFSEINFLLKNRKLKPSQTLDLDAAAHVPVIEQAQRKMSHFAQSAPESPRQDKAIRTSCGSPYYSNGYVWECRGRQPSFDSHPDPYPRRNKSRRSNRNDSYISRHNSHQQSHHNRNCCSINRSNSRSCCSHVIDNCRPPRTIDSACNVSNCINRGITGIPRACCHCSVQPIHQAFHLQHLPSNPGAVSTTTYQTISYPHGPGRVMMAPVEHCSTMMNQVGMTPIGFPVVTPMPNPFGTLHTTGGVPVVVPIMEQ